MKRWFKRLNALTLLAVYAVLATAGEALHQHAPRSLSANGDHGACCCHHHTAAASPKPEGWNRTQAVGRDPGSCLACQALAQLKLGRSSLPTRLEATQRVRFSSMTSEPQTPSARQKVLSARGPPAAFAAV